MLKLYNTDVNFNDLIKFFPTLGLLQQGFVPKTPEHMNKKKAPGAPFRVIRNL